VRYKPTTATTWTTVNVSALSKSISGLTAATAYEFQVAGVCSSTLSSAFSASTLFSTSDIATSLLTIENDEISLDLDMNLYPNPTVSDINISFNISKGEVAKVSIYNILGEIVLQTNYSAETTGKQLIAFDFNSDSKLSSLTSGTYMCCLDARGKRAFKKFILVR